VAAICRVNSEFKLLSELNTKSIGPSEVAAAYETQRKYMGPCFATEEGITKARVHDQRGRMPRQPLKL
jgi:hypothetical protein